jgi:hypothetical protein
MVPHLHRIAANAVLAYSRSCQNICTKTPANGLRLMIQVHCSTPAQIDAIWRMLAHVPDHDFVPAEIYLAGELHYQVVRTGGEQTTAQPAAQPGCTT